MEDKKFEDVEYKDEKSLYGDAEIPSDLEKICIQVEALVMDAYFAGRRSVEKEYKNWCKEKEDNVPICNDCYHNDRVLDMCDKYGIVIPNGCVSCEGYEKKSEHCKLCKMCTFTNETYDAYNIGSVTRCTKKKGNPPINEIHSDGCEDFVNRGAHSCTECVHYSEQTEYPFGEIRNIEYCDAFDDTLGDTVPCYQFKEKETVADTDMVDICAKCEHCHTIEDDAENDITLYHCDHFHKKMRNISACSAFEDVDSPCKCDNCIFAVKKEDCVHCKYYNNLAIRNEGPIYCSNKVTKEYCEENNVNIPTLLTIVEAFNYFKMDGGCDKCGSQRCPANVDMLIDEAYCEAFKKWCKEEDD